MLEAVLRRVLQAVFGGGADISAANPLEVHDPKVGSLISYEGTTTADGAPAGATLVCADLAAPAHPDFDGNLVIITSGDYAGQARDINGTTLAGTVTPASAFGGLIVEGTSFVIAALRLTPAEVAAIEAKLDHAIHGLAALRAVLDLILVDTSTTLEAKLDAIGLVTAALPDGGALTALLADITSILLDTGTTIPGAMALEATLGTHDTDIKALLATIAGYLDTEIDAIKAQTDKIANKMLFSMDFWSDPLEEIVVTNAQVTTVLSSVTVEDLPATATIVRAILMFKFRMVENTNAAENSLDCTAVQPIQVDDSVPTGYVTAIDFVDEMFKIAATTREGGDVIIGDNDIAARVDGNDTYTIQWLNRIAHLPNIQFNDVQFGLRIWYSV